MKYFQLLFLIIILTSCGTKKIQLVKTNYETRVVVDNTLELDRSQQKEKVTEKSIREEALLTNSISSLLVDKIEPNSTSNELEIVEVLSDDETIQKVKSALETERRAHSSRNQLITSTATLPFTLLFPPIFLLSLVFFILGAINLGKSNSARYITPEGERYVSTARIFLTISSIIITIIILLVAFVLLFFFL